MGLAPSETRVSLSPVAKRSRPPTASALNARVWRHGVCVFLVIAGIFEWGWPVGLKLGLADTGLRSGWIAFAGVCMAASGALLLIAQKTIPMGTAYAVWTGIGAVGTFVLGLLLFGEPATFARFFFRRHRRVEAGFSRGTGDAGNFMGAWR